MLVAGKRVTCASPAAPVEAHMVVFLHLGCGWGLSAKGDQVPGGIRLERFATSVEYSSTILLRSAQNELFQGGIDETISPRYD